MATINVADYLQISQLVINRTYTKDSMVAPSNQTINIKNVSDVTDVSVKITGANGVTFTPSTFDLPKLTSRDITVSFSVAQINQLPEGTTSINCIVDCTPINQAPPPEPPHSDHVDHTDVPPPFDDHADVVVTNTTVTVVVNPSNGGSYTLAGGAVGTKGRNVTISATAANGYFFKNWTENGVELSASPNYTFSVDRNYSILCNFLQNPTPPATKYTISVNIFGQGNVTGQPGTSGQWDAGTNFSLSAVPTQGYEFEKWTESGATISLNQTYQFTLDANRTLSAYFKQVDMPPPPPPYGTKLGETCNGTTLVETFADGNGGQYTVSTANSVQCGYQPPPATVYYDMVIGVFSPAGTIAGTNEKGQTVSTRTTRTITVEANNILNVSAIADTGYLFDYITIHSTTGQQTGLVVSQDPKQGTAGVLANGFNEEVRAYFKVDPNYTPHSDVPHTDTHLDHTDVDIHRDHTDTGATHNDVHNDHGDTATHNDAGTTHGDIHDDVGGPIIVPLPPYGMELQRYCSGTTLIIVYADGNGGTYSESYPNDTSCGYVAPTYPPAGTALNQYCSGFDLITILADGSGGTYQQVEYNSPTCGYTPPHNDTSGHYDHYDHYDTGGGGTGGGPGGGGGFELT